MDKVYFKPTKHSCVREILKHMHGFNNKTLWARHQAGRNDAHKEMALKDKAAEARVGDWNNRSYEPLHTSA